MGASAWAFLPPVPVTSRSYPRVPSWQIEKSEALTRHQVAQKSSASCRTMNRPMGEMAPLCFAFIGSYGNVVRYGVMARDCEA